MKKYDQVFDFHLNGLGGGVWYLYIGSDSGGKF